MDNKKITEGETAVIRDGNKEISLFGDSVEEAKAMEKKRIEELKKKKLDELLALIPKEDLMPFEGEEVHHLH